MFLGSWQYCDVAIKRYKDYVITRDSRYDWLKRVNEWRSLCPPSLLPVMTLFLAHL